MFIILTTQIPQFKAAVHNTKRNEENTVAEECLSKKI
jgi:hypothetical protein